MNAPATDPSHGTAVKGLLTAQREAERGQRNAMKQIKALLADAPAELRDRYRRHTTTTPLVRALARCRPQAHDDPAVVAVLTVCKALAQRIEFLDRQTGELSSQLRAFLAVANPVRVNHHAESA
jgi:hypothetical protein